MAIYPVEEVELAGDLKNYNAVKEVILQGLVKEGYLTQEQGEEVASKYAVMLVKNNWLGTVIEKIINKKDSTIIKFVKMV